MVDLDRECTLEKVGEALDRGVDPRTILDEALCKAMEEIGRLFEEGDYSIAELIEASEIFKEVSRILEPHLAKYAAEAKGKGIRIVIGTVQGDIHDIGKNLVATMLKAAGYEVIDLGVDVPPERFVEAVKKYNALVVGMSALLTTTRWAMKDVIEALKKENLRDKVVVVIGGAATNPEFAREIGADGWASNAVEAVRVVNELVDRKLRELGLETISSRNA